MQIIEGMIVKSKSGHDKDRYYLVVSCDDSVAYIADGKRRKLDKPKAKNYKHLQPTTHLVDVTLYTTDKKIRNLLWQWNYSDQAVIN